MRSIQSVTGLASGAAAAMLAGAVLIVAAPPRALALAPDGEQSASANAPAAQLKTEAELEEIVGPIALYPDDAALRAMTACVDCRLKPPAPTWKKSSSSCRRLPPPWCWPA